MEGEARKELSTETLAEMGLKTLDPRANFASQAGFPGKSRQGLLWPRPRRPIETNCVLTVKSRWRNRA